MPFHRVNEYSKASTERSKITKKEPKSINDSQTKALLFPWLWDKDMGRNYFDIFDLFAYKLGE